MRYSIPLNEKSKLIYHYTKWRAALKYIIPEKRLRISSYKKFNDPRETKTFGFGAINKKNENLSIQSELKEKIGYSDIIRNGAKILCFCEDYYTESDWWDGYNLPRMWAQYGDKHKGVCLEFDKDSFINENAGLLNSESTFYDSVNYTMRNEYLFIDHPLMDELGKRKYFDQLRRQNHKYLFFQKNWDWHTESEFRILHFANERQDVYCSIKNSLKRIILGVDFKKELILQSYKIDQDLKYASVDYNDGILKALNVNIDWVLNKYQCNSNC